MTFMGYGNLWRFHRRIIAQQLNQRSVIAFQSGQTQCVRELIHDLLVAPEEFWKKTHKFRISIYTKYTSCSYHIYVIPGSQHRQFS